MTGKPGKIKKKKSIVLAARDVQMVEKEQPAAPPTIKRVVITSGRKRPLKRIRTGPGTPSTRPRTQQVELPREEGKEEELQANSLTATPIDVDDPVMKADMEAEPLPPPEELKTPAGKVSGQALADGEPTFKFFCYRCGQKLMVPVSWANRGYPCGRCGHDIIIPPPLVGNVW